MEIIKRLLFPPRCAACLEPEEALVCSGCLEGVEWYEGPNCARCGAAASGRPPCVQCRGKPMTFDDAVALGPYQARLRDLVIALKQPRHRALGRFLGERLARRLRGRRIDWVVPVPVHRFDFALRGYNAAEELATVLGELRGLRVRTDLLRKRRRTAPQKKLVLARRLRNPAGAYRAAKGLKGRVLLVDDVLTTGATLSACAAALRAAGAVEIGAAVVARG